MVPETANGLECGTCHDKPGTDFSAIIAVPSVTFPSGVTRQEPGHDNVCESCHRGRESKASVDAAIAAGKPAFKNVHYLPAGAVKLGSAVHVGYEYDGKTYVGPMTHVGGAQCTSCHDPVSQPPHLPDHRRLERHLPRLPRRRERRPEEHPADPHRSTTTATATPPSRSPPRSTGWRRARWRRCRRSPPRPGSATRRRRYPYFFKDTNGDKSCSAAEAVASNGFSAWTAGLAKAAFNYQLSRKEPGAWAHNFDYMAQLLYDSTADLGGDVSKLRRP